MRSHHITVVVDGETHRIDTAAELLIDRDDLDESMAKQAALYAWYSYLHERARVARINAEADYESTFDEVYVKIKSGPEKVPVETAKAMARTDPGVKTKARAIIEFESTERTLSSLAYAVSQRKELLVSLARSRGVEMSTPSPAEMDRMKASQRR